MNSAKFFRARFLKNTSGGCFHTGSIMSTVIFLIDWILVIKVKFWIRFFIPFLFFFLVFFFHVSGGLLEIYTAWKVSKYEVFSGPYFPVLGLNTEIYCVNRRIQSEYRIIRTRKKSVFGHFSRSDMIGKVDFYYYLNLLRIMFPSYRNQSVDLCEWFLQDKNIPANIYLFIVNKRNIRKRCEICSKLTIKTPWRCQWLTSILFQLNIFLVFPSLNK